MPPSISSPEEFTDYMTQPGSVLALPDAPRSSSTCLEDQAGAEKAAEAIKLHFSDGVAADGIVYLNNAGQEIKLDRVRPPYSVGSNGCRKVQGKSRPTDVPRERWRVLLTTHKREDKTCEEYLTSKNCKHESQRFEDLPAVPAMAMPNEETAESGFAQGASASSSTYAHPSRIESALTGTEEELPFHSYCECGCSQHLLADYVQYRWPRNREGHLQMGISGSAKTLVQWLRRLGRGQVSLQNAYWPTAKRIVLGMQTLHGVSDTYCVFR